MTEQLKKKKTFFAALDLLDESDDEQGNSGGHAASRKDHAGIKLGTKKSAYSSDQRVSPRETLDARPSCDTKERRSSCLAVSRTSNPVSFSHSKATTTMPTIKSSGPASKKRKLNNVKTIPGDQQIFKGLTFYFFPNNDVSPVRRLRIQRAQEYGARWSREWGDNVTHAILDKGLQTSDLRGYLKIEYLPADVIIVNESYPPECIQFRSILNHSQLRFQVDLAPLASHKEDSPSALPLPDFLPLKPSTRETKKSPEPSNLYAEDSGPEANPRTPNSQGSEVTGSSKNLVEEEVTDKGIRERDALDDIIQEAKAISHLPLDLIESPDEDNSAGTDSETSSSEGSNHKTKKKLPGEDKSNSHWTKAFACMQEFDPSVTDKNPNSGTIDILQQMLDYYTRNADQWRTLAYRRAIAALRKQPTKIITQAQARVIPGVGERLASKIEEIVMTNRLRRLENANNSPEDLLIQEFMGIYGAGLPQASKWVAQGYKSLAELLEKAPLTKQQRIGVERYNDFAQRIPRKEVEAHGAIVRKAVLGVDKDMQVIIGGSYRRGAATCGDIDCLITKPGCTLEQIRTTMLALVVPKLTKNGFLKASLAISSHHDGSKWHGASALPGTDLWRRIDLLFVPDAEIGAALIYFTGNDIFNRSMRLLARKKGMCLNQKGLFTDVLRDRQVKLNAGRLVEGRDERQIFAVLGVPWRPPEHRIC